MDNASARVHSLALRVDDPTMTSWWSGEFEFPLSASHREGVAPLPSWYYPEEDPLLAEPPATAP